MTVKIPVFNSESEFQLDGDNYNQMDLSDSENNGQSMYA